MAGTWDAESHGELYRGRVRRPCGQPDIRDRIRHLRHHTRFLRLASLRNRGGTGPPAPDGTREDPWDRPVPPSIDCSC
ncbi:hypothetical protein GCM10027068_50120 [Prescottella soli]